MAAKRSSAQRDELAAFVQHLYAESGAATWKEYADRAQVHWASLSDWQTGKSVPDGWNLYRLIQAASESDAAVTALGLVRENSRVEAQADRMLRTVGDQLRAQSQLLHNLTTTTEKLTVVADRLETQAQQVGQKPA